MRVSLAVAAAGLLMALSAFAFEIDVFRYGGAMILVGSWLFLSGLVVALVFRRRARAFDRSLHS